MTFRRLLIAMIALFALVLLATMSRPLRAVTVAAASSGYAEIAAGESVDDDGSPIEGRRIYMRENCYSCHGGFAGGGMCPSLRKDRPQVDDVREAVRNGKPQGMPPFPELTEVDIQNLCAYFQSLRTPREPTFTHWWEPVPTQ